MNSKIEALLIAVLYLFTIYFYTLPLQASPLPFGDVDSTTHFTSGDWMAQNDKSMFSLPYYMTYVVGTDANGKLVYPPQFNTAEAVVESFTNVRFLSVYIFYAVISSLFVLTSFILVRKLYGFWPAYLSSFFLIFSSRDYMTYLWGMWPQMVSFVFVPLMIYMYHQYVSKLLEGKKSEIYLYIAIILTIIQFCFHPQGSAISIAIIAIYSILLIIKEKKFIFPWQSIVKGVILGIILLVLFAPFQIRIVAGKVGLGESTNSEFTKNAPLSNLLHWYERPDRNVGVPDSYFTFKDTYTYWFLPFLLIGIGVILYRRNRSDLLMIAFLIAMYLFLHLENIGFPRAHRFLEIEAWLFAPLMVIGLSSLASFVNESLRPKLKVGLFALFALMTILLLAVPAFPVMKDAYPEYVRPTTFHIDLANWMRENLPEDANIMYVGYTTFAKKKWIRAISDRNIIYDNPVIPQQHRAINLTDHVLIDYSEAMIWTQRNEEAIKQLHEWEQKNLADKKLLYEDPTKQARIYVLK